MTSSFWKIGQHNVLTFTLQGKRFELLSFLGTFNSK
jgi:hypothetical protein